jgi:GrpB-like predicted nucleotidyltransferase (UPF0157 family)
MRNVVVVDYDPKWPVVFEELRARTWPAVQDVALSIEHVGSTSVPGLAAKPIIDISIVVPSRDVLPAAIRRLTSLGYVHQGELGVEGREAFKAPADLPVHNMYVCPAGSLGLINQIAVRDHLRRHPESAAAYARLKKALAEKFPADIDSYVEGKTDLVLEILRAERLPADKIAAIELANRRPAQS